MVKLDVRINCSALICIKYKGTKGIITSVIEEVT